MENWNSLSKTVARRIEEMIATDEFRSGARLPSQRDMSSRFGVSRASLREALSILEVSGKLRTEPGRGSYRSMVTDQVPVGGLPRRDIASGASGLPAVPADTTYPKSEISRFRHLIEGQSGRLAAMRITDEEVQRLEKNLSVFKAQTRAMDLEASAATDFEFHQLIVEFSGVKLFTDLHDSFRGVIMQAVQMYRSQYTRAWEPVAEHERILEALRRRDPDETLYYLQSHIVRSAERLGIINANEIL